ncbi:hypothetical protein C7445_104110 [Alicyclobacillus sacchari]|uniref:Uncharacterized protein n=1 Tax=Alicyclobacillus sacchari TaxID=392010 RepID=A0A4R8LQ00_9BACL|nr:hypothetical protein [Alicyclobacillus sacchari]TDY49599.1 hypothetical protein C7445_104110 [Alicyclobacillus sacchari]GMA58521.1 hypothetical protein GCM10025858_30240 [Alicyclobacillus sacchari]
MRYNRGRQYIWLIILVVVVALARIRIGGSVPLPASYEKLAGGQIRIQVQAKPVPSTATGEQWNLEKHVQNGQTIYTANLYMNGHEQLLFPSLKTQSKTAAGTLYESNGKIRFGSQDYHAIDLFVAADGKSGYIDFAKS